MRDDRLARAARLQSKSEASELAQQAVGADRERVGERTGSRELRQTID